MGGLSWLRELIREDPSTVGVTCQSRTLHSTGRSEEKKQGTLLSVSWLWMWPAQFSQARTHVTHDALYPGTVSWNEPFLPKGFISLLCQGIWSQQQQQQKKGRQIPLLGSFHKDPCATGCYSNKSCSREQAVSKVILASNRWRSGTSHWLKQAKSPGGYLGVSEAASWVIFKLCLFSLKLTWIYDVNVCVEGKYWKRK